MRRLFGTTILLVLISCKTIKPKAPEITVTDKDTVIVQSLSFISVPIKIDLQPYFDETNAELPTVFKGKDEQCEGVSAEYEFRRSPIQFEGIGQELHYTINGKYALKLNYCAKCTELFNDEGNCLTPRIYATCGIKEPMRKMSIAYRTEIGITEDYSLISKTQLKEVKALSPCKITVFNYNATERVQKEITTRLKEIEVDIDKEISSISLKEDLEGVWEALKEPIDLEGFGFFAIRPQSISLSELEYMGDYVSMNALLSAFPVVQLEKPKLDTTALPYLSVHREKDGFNVEVDVIASYDSLNAILNRSLAGFELTLKNKLVVFDSLAVHGAADSKISLEVNFSGDKKGTIYLQGTPEIDASTQILSLPDLEFDLETKNMLLRSAKWMFDKSITKKVKESAVIDINPYIDTLKLSIAESLNGEIAEGIYMKGSIESISLADIHPRSKDLFIRTRAIGKLQVNM